jgi:deoxycytidylate deaminase
MGIAVIVGILIAALVGSVVYSHKYHNPVEQVAADLIEKETGVDVDKLLPPDK